MKAISTKYVSPTNTKGSRIKAYDGDRNSVTLSYDDALNSDQNHSNAAIALCHKMNWFSPGHTKLHGGHTKNGMVFVWDDDITVTIK